MASTPVARSQYAANGAKPAGRLPTTPGTINTSPKKRELCRVAMARCAATGSIDFSRGDRKSTRLNSSHVALSLIPSSSCKKKQLMPSPYVEAKDTLHNVRCHQHTVP